MNNCETPINIQEEGGEQGINVQPEGAEQGVKTTLECLRVTPIEDRNYNKFYNKPQINGVELVGNKTSPEIHVQHEMDEITEQEIDNIIFA